jgi:PhnB protein
MAVITTLGFAGRTEEALAFYRDALDAETVFLMRFRDCPDQSNTKPGMEDLIFHATFQIDGSEFMATDVGFNDTDTPAEFSGFSLLLRFDSIDKAKSVFMTLAEGGTIAIPLEKSSFTAWYGIVIDRFGVSWKINVQQDGG